MSEAARRPIPLPETRTLDAATTKIREAIYELARSGKAFSIDDVFDKVGGRDQSDVVHANLLSAAQHGLLERAGTVKSRSSVDAQEWIAGRASKRRTVQSYRGAPRFRMKESK